MAPFDDPAAFVQRSAVLAADSEPRLGMAREARQTILEGYRWERTTEPAWELYRTAIERFHRRLPDAEVPRLPARDYVPTPRRLDDLSAVPSRSKSWVRAMEHLSFMRALQHMGAIEPASRLGLRAL